MTAGPQNFTPGELVKCLCGCLDTGEVVRHSATGVLVCWQNGDEEWIAPGTVRLLSAPEMIAKLDTPHESNTVN